MNRAELLVAVGLMLWIAFQPNDFADVSASPAAFTILGVTLIILAHRLRHKIPKS
ncbi:MAG TPA: hypothetical protein VGA27_12655 [Candidatus Binatia bacterium]|jgi:hypothetical protein